jgi:hypothetical protein
MKIYLVIILIVGYNVYALADTVTGKVTQDTISTNAKIEKYLN